MTELPPVEHDRKTLLTRRRFLAIAGGGFGGALLELNPWAPGLIADAAESRVIELRRREDMLRLTVRLYNATVTNLKGGVKIAPSRILGLKSHLVVEFPGQHVAEAAFSGSAAPAAPVGSRLAMPSRLAFELLEPIPFDLDALLDWAALKPSLVPVALEPLPSELLKPPTLREPTATETAIEVPWRLLLSPPRTSRWFHPTEPVEVGGRVEPWRTQLRGPTANQFFSPQPNSVRAVWARDDGSADILKSGNPKMDTRRRADASSLLPTGPGKPFARMTLGPADRGDIVRASSDFVIRPRPEPIVVDRLELGAVGARFDLRGDWTDNPTSSLIHWSQSGTMGRDHVARLVRRGVLHPFGHRAVETTLTERIFTTVDGTTKPTAQLRQRVFVTVIEPEKDYAGAGVQPFGGRNFPFTTVRLTTTTTPDFQEKIPLAGRPTAPSAYLPVVDPGGAAFTFDAVGTDWAGNTVTFSTPLAFVFGPDDLRDTSGHIAVLQAVNARLAATDDPELRLAAFRNVDMRGQEVAIAQPTAPGSTTVVMQSISFLGQLPDGDKAVEELADEALQKGFAAVTPVMDQAQVVLEEANQIGSTIEGAAQTVGLSFEKEFIGSGFDTNPTEALQNPGQVFAEFKDQAGNLADQAVDFVGDKAAGLVTPQLVPAGLSRNLGLVSGTIDKIRSGELDAGDIFNAALDAKLLGGIELKKIISFVGLPKIPDPKLPTVDLPPPPEALTLTRRKLDDGIEVHLEWKPKLQTVEPFIAYDGKAPTKNRKTTFEVDILNTTRYTTDPPSVMATYRALSELVDFDLDFTFLKIEVKRLKFTSATGETAAVDLDLGEIEFGGALSFVEEFRQFLKTGGLGPTIDVTGAGVAVGYAITLPAIQLGAFALQNLGFAIDVNVPFDGSDVVLGAKISSPQDPFFLGISALGGGGWAAIDVKGTRVERLEIALEVAGQFSLNLGVASGGIGIAAGIYLGIKNTIENGVDKQAIELGGYVRVFGEVSVLGLVSVSVEFNMTLQYHGIEKPDGTLKHRAYGQATLVVQVEVFLLSKSVELSVEKYFDANPGDPTFQDTLPEPSFWNEYCDAFAPIGAVA